MAFQLENLEILARGGEADLYILDENRILRVLRKEDPHALEREKAVMPLLDEACVSVPRIYEYTEVEGNQAEVMERIKGETMLEFMLSHPFSLKRKVRKFAKIHQQILFLHGGKPLPSIQEKLAAFEEQPGKVEGEIFDFVMQIARGLPSGDSICHGDFHPGNILMNERAPYVIDWSGVHTGSALSDIAHTYVLMTHAPQTPGQDARSYRKVRFFAHRIAKLYLRDMEKWEWFDWEEFRRWKIVMTLLRVYDGLPSEKEERKQELRKAYAAFSRGLRS